MNKRNIIWALTLLSCAVLPAKAENIVHVGFEANGASGVSGGSIKVERGGDKLTVTGRNAAQSLPGAVGAAWRTDGYSDYAYGQIKADADYESMTFSIWIAPQTYPVIKLDEPTEDQMLVAGTIDAANHTGFGFYLGYTGKYSFRCYSAGWPLSLSASDIIPCYEWSHLVAVIDGKTGDAKLYRNGVEVASSGCLVPVKNSGATTLNVGKTPGDTRMDVFNIQCFNGLIDDLDIYDEALALSVFAGKKPENDPELGNSGDRFADNLMRPGFHGMPAANWTNECHGMTYSDGRYHLFFQQNANGPYMTRLHWGHISSADLCTWREEKIAIAPSADYDIKGCWSGHVFTDAEVSGGKPMAIYTAVDYGRAVVAKATPKDETLLDWEKDPRIVINGRPTGLSDDFRDPSFFRAGNQAYIIVGSAKNGISTTTLHKYIPSLNTFSNDGSIFFQGTSKAVDGTFFEMPNVTEMGNGKFLFTTTPIGTSKGVYTQYRTGSISENGAFVADNRSSLPRQVELISRDGYGLLSPTIYKHGDKTIMLGIVPDKLAGEYNARMGWAHLFSLPREISLDGNNQLVQKPYEGLRVLRSETAFAQTDVALNGSVSLEPVSGRQIEVLGKFKVGSGEFGFNLLKNHNGCAKITYRPGSNELVVDLSTLARWKNDEGVFNGVYSCNLPESITPGSEMTLNVFFDGCILDIFVADKWATSIRVFPTADTSNSVEAFGTGDAMATELKAWNLSASLSNSVMDAFDDPFAPVNVYSVSGVLLKRNTSPAEALEGLYPGLYIVGGKKVFKR